MISGASDEELDIAIARADVLLELQPKIDELKKENKKLKQQLEEKENQQKEFMEWLESESHRLSGDILLNSSFIEVRTILLKYKEIIGADNEN